MLGALFRQNSPPHSPPPGQPISITQSVDEREQADRSSPTLLFLENKSKFWKFSDVSSFLCVGQMLNSNCEHGGTEGKVSNV
jgi:hypothetical protein